ncbi:mercuric reductase [Filimonas effusa]|uniref:Mercuric reductase n=1 Tax=Filimonas effusa TaxID=2508721 RepID=A0A4Q1DC71_9BACT|nr:mercuric reductase [Filimonas effusa]RXK86129.1 mercuric reductase [Filimonas effusa]
MQKFDALVIGAGQAGIPLAKRLAKAGLSTAIIEKRVVGGTCINDGCTPTKLMVGHAAVAHIVRNSSTWGISVASPPTVDFKTIHEHKQQIVNSFRGSAQRGIEETEHLVLIEGEASFTGDKILEIRLKDGNTEQYTAPLIFINAGCSMAIPPIPGLDQVTYYTSTSLLDLESLPETLVIIGGSYIALELGQLYHRLGSKVTVIEQAPNLLPKEDNDVSACIKDFLEKEGIQVFTNARVDLVEQEKSSIRVRFTEQAQGGDAKKNNSFADTTSGSAQTEVTGSHLLIATGRKPQSVALQLEKAGVEVDKNNYIKVDKYLQTNVKGIYALGDIKGGPAFTHVAYNDYVVILKNIIEKQDWSIEGRLIPYCMFTDPQLGRVGLSEKQAKEQGIPFVTYTLSMERVARALETGHTTGMMKAIVHRDTDKILGAAIIGEQGGEVMTVLQMAIQAGLTCDAIRWGMFAHPLYAESLNNLFMEQGKPSTSS